MLIYSGSLDVIVGAPLTDAFLPNLDFNLNTHRIQHKYTILFLCECRFVEHEREHNTLMNLITQKIDESN